MNHRFTNAGTHRTGAPAAPGNSSDANALAGLERVLVVETPEHVDLGFEIADLGSRFVALFSDTLLLACGLAGLGLLTMLVANLDLSDWLAGWGLALVVLVLFLVFWGYFVLFEAFRGGRTPGKKWAGIRVVHEAGHPITLRGAAIRNLVRVVDVQPMLTCLVGGAAMMVHPRTQRLGDMAAGTIVVRDRGESEVPEEQLWRAGDPSEGRPRLSEELYAALEGFVERRKELSVEARDRIAGQLNQALPGELALPAGSDRTHVEERLAAVHADEALLRAGAGTVWSAGTAQAAALVRAHGAMWLEYRDLVRRAQKRGLDTLDEERVERFAVLYRTAASDLARLRTYGASWPLLFSLERWVGAGHNLLYRAEAPSLRKLWWWLVAGFPQLVRRRRWAVALAAVFLLAPAFATYTAVRLRPTLIYDLAPHEMIVRAETAEDRAARGAGYVEVPEVSMPVFSSGIITNNVQVTFFAFAGGVLAGLGTAFLLFVNGVHLGAVFALFANLGVTPILWSFVAPHGVIELAAICIAGAGGLLLGKALLAPGRRTRVQALAACAREAVSLLAGTSLMLALAGAVEGFVSPAPLPAPVKMAIAGALAASILSYLILAGRDAAPFIPDRGT